MKQLSIKAMEVEVFKTDVADSERADWLKNLIEINFRDCKVNFDLEDCDRILRVVYDGILPSDQLIELLKANGCTAEVLSDVVEMISLEELTK